MENLYVCYQGFLRGDFFWYEFGKATYNLEEARQYCEGINDGLESEEEAHDIRDEEAEYFLADLSDQDESKFTGKIFVLIGKAFGAEKINSVKVFFTKEDAQEFMKMLKDNKDIRSGHPLYKHKEPYYEIYTVQISE